MQPMTSALLCRSVDTAASPRLLASTHAANGTYSLLDRWHSPPSFCSSCGRMMFGETGHTSAMEQIPLDIDLAWSKLHWNPYLLLLREISLHLVLHAWRKWLHAEVRNPGSLGLPRLVLWACTALLLFQHASFPATHCAHRAHLLDTEGAVGTAPVNCSASDIWLANALQHLALL